MFYTHRLIKNLPLPPYNTIGDVVRITNNGTVMVADSKDPFAKNASEKNIGSIKDERFLSEEWIEPFNQDHYNQMFASEYYSTKSSKKLTLFSDPILLHNAGGEWLGAVREYIKCNIKDGDRVEWGSNIDLFVTIARLQEIGAFAAAAVYYEWAKDAKLSEYFQRGINSIRNLLSQQNITIDSLRKFMNEYDESIINKRYE